MTYHYNKLSGTIYTHPHEFTKPITNPIYNIIIQEAKELNIEPRILFEDCLAIYTRTITIRFRSESITIYTTSDYTAIPYEQYTTLKQLIATHT